MQLVQNRCTLHHWLRQQYTVELRTSVLPRPLQKQEYHTSASSIFSWQLQQRQRAAPGVTTSLLLRYQNYPDFSTKSTNVSFSYKSTYEFCMTDSWKFRLFRADCWLSSGLWSFHEAHPLINNTSEPDQPFQAPRRTATAKNNLAASALWKTESAPSFPRQTEYHYQVRCNFKIFKRDPAWLLIHWLHHLQRRVGKW